MRFAIVFISLCFATSLVSFVWAIENDNSNQSIDGLNYVYPKTMRVGEDEILYPLVLLRMALQYSGAKYTLKASSISMPQSRSLKQIIMMKSTLHGP